MNTRPSPLSPPASRRGIALVVVLAFVALLTVLVVAYFSHTALQRQVSSSSAGQTNVNLFALGAVNTLIGDLKQEIADGSDPIKDADGNEVEGTFHPSVPATMVPARVGTADSLPNLVKRSARNQPFYSGDNYKSTPPVRASGISSEADPAPNGRFISLSRWNKALLLPKASSASTAEPKPIGDFQAPDWVYASRDGANPVTWSADLKDSGGDKYVVGRYAYAIYDEGGLLDVNVAGHPSTLPPEQSSQKANLAFADLTQIPGLANPGVIDALVGWRNYASARPGGGFPEYTFDDTESFYKTMLSSSTGFMKVANTALVNSQSDRLFTSRQQLIEFFKSLAQSGAGNPDDLQNALQYLTTFSRDLNQPSFTPAADRPTVKSRANGGNDAGDFSGADAIVNPGFLSVRVKTQFTRNDGTSAATGEPLVKQRFALNRLAWLTYEGPSASASSATQTALQDAGLPPSLIDQGTAENIEAYFGLTWNPSDGSWKYNHSTGGGSAPINALSNVSGREADFFELLKAAISVGSIGKAYMHNLWTGVDPDNTTPEGYQRRRDNSIDSALIQIGANIIDQFDFDGYPTRIVFNDGSSIFNGHDQEYRGVEDLPYLYRVREGRIMVEDSIPAQYTLPIAYPTAALAAAALVNEGSGAVVQQPEIWNPHGWKDSVPPASPRPYAFRLTAASEDPNRITSWNVQPGVQWRFKAPAHAVGNNATAGATSPSAKVNAVLSFDVPQNRPDLFREPTLLVKSGLPAGSNLSGGTPIASLHPSSQLVKNGASDDKQYIGIVLGTVPMAWRGSIPAKGIDGTAPVSASPGIIPAGFVYYPTAVNGITYRLQYRNPSGNYVTYDEKFADLVSDSDSGDAHSPPTYFNKPFNRSNEGAYADNIIGSELSVLSFDPRSSRFGMIYAGGGRSGGSLFMHFPVVKENAGSKNFPVGWAGPNSAAHLALMTARPDEYQGFLFSTWAGFPNAFGRNSGPTAAGWGPYDTRGHANDGPGTAAVVRPGMFSQNNPEVGTASSLLRFAGDTFAPSSNPTPMQIFADPDNVVRRAMAAFVPAGGATPAAAPASGDPSGLPMKIAHTYSTGTARPNSEIASRPIVLNRPFRSAAELGYVFSGTPWRNLDMSTPESGAAAFLDVFSISDTIASDSLVAGKLNLNTRQAPVLNAILAGAYTDEFSTATSGISQAETNAVSTALVNRTKALSTQGKGPLTNLSDLVGKWNAPVNTGSFIDGGASFVGFGSDRVNNSDDLSSSLSTDKDKRIQRFRESAIRALAGSGQTRIWNLMIDLVAQTGRFPANATAIDSFIVEGETRYWAHLAIDRFTGDVIDQQIEVVKE